MRFPFSLHCGLSFCCDFLRAFVSSARRVIASLLWAVFQLWQLVRFFLSSERREAFWALRVSGWMSLAVGTSGRDFRDLESHCRRLTAADDRLANAVAASVAPPYPGQSSVRWHAVLSLLLCCFRLGWVHVCHFGSAFVKHAESVRECVCYFGRDRTLLGGCLPGTSGRGGAANGRRLVEEGFGKDGCLCRKDSELARWAPLPIGSTAT